MNELEINRNEAEDEISLIDLFAVVIRHRFMIIFGTILVSVLAICYLFIYPLVVPKASKAEVTIDYSIAVCAVPDSINTELPSKFKNIKSLVNSEFNDIVFLAKELKQCNPFIDDKMKELNEFQFNTFVQNLMKNKKIQISPSPVREEIRIEFVIPEEQLPVATKLVDNMVESINNSIETVFLKELNNIKKTKEETYQEILNAYSENSNISDAQTLMLTVRQINEFTANYKSMVSRDLEPFVVIMPLGRVKKLVIITFAAFFVFVFIAFLKNAVYNIKQDSEASEKIKAAWTSGKIGKK